MLGGIRKTAIAGATLGLLSIGLATGPAPVQAAPQGCVIAAQPADVSADQAAPTQTSFGGDWTDVDDGSVRPRYGLYYPPTDPTASRADTGNMALPRQENFGGTANTPATPVQTGRAFEWRLNGRCQDSGQAFISSGHGVGYCGRSVGLGVGSIATPSGPRSYIVRWESLGSQLHLVDPSALGSVNAQPNLPDSPNGSCKDGTAIVFTVTGNIVDTTS